MVSSWVKATSISPRVKEAVYERDGGLCIFCGRRGLPEAHVVPRSRGGMGVEENIITVCRQCHNAMDGADRKKKLEIAKRYLRERYPGWDEKKLEYHKGGSYERPLDKDI